MFSFLPVKKLSMHRTSCPSLSRRSHKCEPRKPAPPVTITRLRNIPPPASARATCSRDCRHSSKREEGCSEMNGGSEACVGLVVARGDATELFEPLEAILDEMPPLVHVGVMRDGHLAVILGRDDRERAPLVEFGRKALLSNALSPSSHYNSLESGCELRVQRGTRVIMLLVSFDSEVRLRACGKLRRTLNRHTGLSCGTRRRPVPSTHKGSQ